MSDTDQQLPDDEAMRALERQEAEAAEAEAAALAAETAAQMQAAAMAALQAKAEAEAENAERDALAFALAALAAENAKAVPTPLPALDEVQAPRGKFGPTFLAELAAADVLGFPCVWTDSHVIFGGDIAPDQRAAVVAVIEAHDPTKKLPEPVQVIVVSSVDFYRRMTPAEADEVEDVIAKQSARDRRIFEKASTFRSDAPEWPTLVALATGLFGAERAAEILKSSEGL